MGDCRAASSSKEMFLICAVSMCVCVCVCVCVCLLACAWVCAFRQKVNWVTAVVPETQTTGFVIAVTFLPAPPAHSRRWCEWADAQGGVVLPRPYIKFPLGPLVKATCLKHCPL